MLEHYRRELESFQQMFGREVFLFYSGQKRRLELSPVYERFSDLFRLDTKRDLENHYEATDPYFETRRRGISLLRAHVERHFLNLKVADLTEQIANTEAEAVVSFAGQELPFLRITDSLATEPDPEKRRQLEESRLRLVGETNEWREERLHRIREATRRLGYEDMWTMVSQWHHCDLSGYVDQFARFLEETESLYSRHLTEFLSQTTGASSDQMDHADIESFFHLGQYAELFPPEGVLPVYRETLRNLGIDPDTQENIEIDLVHRQEKHPGVWCIPVRWPREIKLSMSLRGGFSDYDLILQGGGQAQRAAWTSPLLPVDFKLQEASALTRGFGFLFRYLTLDPLWLDEMLHFQPPLRFTRLCWLKKLFSIRREAARSGFERTLYTRKNSTTVSQQYADALTAATGFKHYAEDYLNHEPGAGLSATSLGGWLLEAQLREHLKTRFGKKWWHSRQARDVLIDLWNTGDRYTAEELAPLADLGQLSPDALSREIGEQLK